MLQGIPHNSASFLLSIIGITNTFGRVFCGYIADFPKVDSLLLNNICLVVSTLAVAATPLCTTYEHYVAMSIFFGLAICKFGIQILSDLTKIVLWFLYFPLAGYISLTSIILVDLLGKLNTYNTSKF